MSLMSPAAPPERTRVRLDDYLGKVVLMTPVRLDANVETKFGYKDAVSITLSVWKRESGDFDHVDDVRIFNAHLVGELKKARSRNAALVGRLERDGNAIVLRELPPEELAAVQAHWTQADAFEDNGF